MTEARSKFLKDALTKLPLYLGNTPCTLTEGVATVSGSLWQTKNLTDVYHITWFGSVQQLSEGHLGIWACSSGFKETVVIF